MENFVVSARKYRPQTFDTVVGQVHITSTLKNAIRSSHVAQAYLFCGPRGVGKTTCARILAKTLNCFNITKDIEACDKCESCASFNEGHSLNIYELDAASNNSVEDIRNLINQVSFAPQIGTRKVYIIDEVHMLSQAAFNAFLKTLEEPPKHAIFILATTEKHKIIPTILSRCQIFDFNRIRTEDTVEHLASIAKKEKVKTEDDALHLIAQKSDGAMRDALSIFDQLVSVSGNNITYKIAIDNLSVLDYDYYFKVTDALLEKNTSLALLIFNEILNKGFDGHHFLNGLAEHLRNLLVCIDEITIQLLEVSNTIRERYKTQSKKTDSDFLIRSLSILNKADVQYKSTRNQRLLVELTLLQLCSVKGSSTGGEKKNEILSPTNQNTTNSPSVPKVGESIKITAPIITSEVREEVPTYKKQLVDEIKKTATTNPPSEPKSEIKNIAIKPSNKGILSISSLTNGVALPDTVVKPIILSENKKTNEKKDLETAWKEFAEALQIKNKMNLSSTLLANKPNMENDSTILFNVLNQVQEDEINAIKTDLLAYLRSELKIIPLQLKIVVNKNETERKPYTGEEKFQRLAEKNPILHKLRQKFNLEIDY